MQRGKVPIKQSALTVVSNLPGGARKNCGARRTVVHAAQFELQVSHYSCLDVPINSHVFKIIEWL